MVKVILSAVLFLFSTTLRAQTAGGSVDGLVTDNNRKVIEGADLVLRNSRDSVALRRAFSDSAGNFHFTGVKDGSYFVSVQLIGYSSVKTDTFTVTNSVTSITRINLILQPAAKMLNSASVVSTKPLIDNQIDKTVVNVDAYITNAGNTALDLLGTAPNVSVDQTSGTISIRGKAGTIVMIDGKPTYLGGTDLMNLLNAMPSSQVDQIEIMTQPSAKYDASGNSGIINILTKKNKQEGFNTNLSLNYTQGVYPKSLNNAVFNYHRNKVNIFGNASYNYTKTFTDRTWLRYFNGDTLNNLFTQANRDLKVTSNWLVNAGVDYSVSSKTTIGLLATHNDSKYNDLFTSHSILQDLKSNDAIEAITDGASTYGRPWESNSLNLNYRTSSSQHRQFGADLNYDTYVFSYNELDNTIDENPDGSFNSKQVQRGLFPYTIKIYTAKADFASPLSKTTKLEAGIKASIVKTDDNAQYFLLVDSIYQLNAQLTNHFLYNENVNAAYVNFSGKIGNWSFQTGLRAEQTNNHGRQLTDNQSFARHYLQLFPSAYLSYSADKNSTYEISYSSRIDRPNYTDLNPFVQYVDVYTRMSGNVNLNPVFANNLEISYNFKHSLTVSAFYTSSDGVINPVYLQSDTSKIQLITLQNITREVSTGLSMNYSARIKNWWNVTAFYTLFNNHFRGPINDGFLDAGQTTQMISLTQQFLLGDGWAAEMTAAYRSKALLFAMFYRGPWRANTFGVSKDILNKKGSIKLKLTDPFNVTRNNYNYTKFESLFIDRRFHEENQRIGITFTYRFSGGQKTTAPNKNNYKPEENQRVTTPGT